MAVLVITASTVASPPVAAAADEVEHGDVDTWSADDRIVADIFRIASDSDQRPTDLEAYCYEAHAAEANARAATDPGPAPGAAGDAPTTEAPPPPPHRGIAPDVDADTSPCRGRSARLAVEPPGAPCAYGHVAAVAGYFTYDLEARTFRFLSSEDYAGYRRAGGDGGRWDVERLCLDVFSGVADAASFEQAIAPPELWKSPDPVGITGVETWLWYEFVEPESHTMRRRFTVDADGLPLGVEATIWVDAVRWDMDGDGTWDAVLDLPDHRRGPAADYLEAGGAGAPGAAAATHVYDAKGVHQVFVEVEWRGTYRYLGYAGNLGFYQPITSASSTEYRVCEVVGVHTLPGDPPEHPGCPPGP